MTITKRFLPLQSQQKGSPVADVTRETKRLKRSQDQLDTRNIKTWRKEEKGSQHIQGRREVSAEKFIKEMSFINVSGVNLYKFKVHEPRRFFKLALSDK